ncbi:hypothetical protein ACFQYP_17140 [Nonomuraea antimicrobica]
MRAYGVTYDTGFLSAGTTTHEPFDPDAVRREMQIIRDELHCDAVRVTGETRTALRPPRTTPPARAWRSGTHRSPTASPRTS